MVVAKVALPCFVGFVTTALLLGNGMLLGDDDLTNAACRRENVLLPSN